MSTQISVREATDSRDLADFDARLDAVFGPADPATERLIAASQIAHAGQLAELETLSTALTVGVAGYGRQLRRVEREAGLR